MTNPSAADAVRIRPTVAERAFFLLVCSFTPVIMTVWFTENIPWELLALLLLVLVSADQIVRRNGVELTSKEAIVRSPLWSTKRLRWGLVLAVTSEDTPTGRRAVLWTAGQAPSEPRVATHVYVSRRQLDDTFELIHTYWLKNRGY